MPDAAPLSWLASAGCCKAQHSLACCRYIPTNAADGTPKCYKPASTDARAREVTSLLIMRRLACENYWNIFHRWPAFVRQRLPTAKAL